MTQYSLPDELLAGLMQKRLIFTVTTGRTGTKYLANALDHLADVKARHEPRPEFGEVMRRVQTDPDLAFDFLVRRKLPVIASEPAPVYVETNHAFSKGFLEPLMALGIIPDLIILRRSNREVALSLLRLGEIPGRSEWYLSPEDPDVLPLDGWYNLVDYQLCFWYCLEVERRTQVYGSLVQQKGGLVAETSLSEITTTDGFVTLLNDLQLPPLSSHALHEFETTRLRRVNTKAERRHVGGQSVTVPSNLDELEEEVMTRLAVSRGKGDRGAPSDPGSDRTNKPGWFERVDAIGSFISQSENRDLLIVLVDDGRLPTYVFEQDNVVSFPANDGRFSGRPDGDRQAVEELQRAIDGGAGLIVFAWTAIWWLEAYPMLRSMLREQFDCVVENDTMTAFSLLPPAVRQTTIDQQRARP